MLLNRKDKAAPQGGRDRRELRDRRQTPTNPFGWRAFRGRRHTVRRASDRSRHPYTDRYSRLLLLLSLLLILLCVADGLYTLLHISAGAVEVNPLMNSLLSRGPFIFFGAKFILTACGIILLVLYWQTRLARWVLTSCVAVYTVLFCYQVMLFFSRH